MSSRLDDPISQMCIHLTSAQHTSDGSPTSTTFSGDSSRLNDSSRSTFQRLMSTPLSLGTPGRKVAIRSDPSLVTCFDPADKELYDLWVPKQ
ncbi:hypothetical protein PILCRDRAFT_811353 [Piloderma croceum F 1598]|uniref:Uncharacterized protein n=1 Tax=Piloderma croceum (strain F 1598) TaxID=765440 RepID=A0A0C3BWD5_PILCF|nr:hypothetical protein PILCRDRAFT_811353 [Piloderma croceum F 1598]